MKIVILVDYSNSNFNKDFQMANILIDNGHNVFLAINDNQFDDLKLKCDRAYLGYSSSIIKNNAPYIEDANDLNTKKNT